MGRGTLCHMVVFSILIAGIQMFALQGKFQVELTDVSIPKLQA